MRKFQVSTRSLEFNLVAAIRGVFFSSITDPGDLQTALVVKLIHAGANRIRTSR